MSAQLKCDICLKPVKNLDNFGTINKEFQIAERIQHACRPCSKKIAKKLNNLSLYYTLQVTRDMRDWIMEEREKHL